MMRSIDYWVPVHYAAALLILAVAAFSTIAHAQDRVATTVLDILESRTAASDPAPTELSKINANLSETCISQPNVAEGVAGVLIGFMQDGKPVGTVREFAQFLCGVGGELLTVNTKGDGAIASLLLRHPEGYTVSVGSCWRSDGPDGVVNCPHMGFATGDRVRIGGTPAVNRVSSLFALELFKEGAAPLFLPGKLDYDAIRTPIDPIQRASSHLSDRRGDPELDVPVAITTIESLSHVLNDITNNVHRDAYDVTIYCDAQLQDAKYERYGRLKARRCVATYMSRRSDFRPLYALQPMFGVDLSTQERALNLFSDRLSRLRDFAPSDARITFNYYETGRPLRNVRRSAMSSPVLYREGLDRDGYIEILRSILEGFHADPG